MGKQRKGKGFIRHHSLSLVTVGVLIMSILIHRFEPWHSCGFILR
jgi:hypothetical protein